MKKRVRLKYNNIFKLLLFIVLIVFVVILFTKHITNIYICGNNYYKDQEIIELARLNNYPLSLLNPSKVVQKLLEKDEYISSAKVYKKGLGKIYINIEENYPLFYNLTTKKTILFNLDEKERELVCPYLINYIPDSLYSKFMNNMKKLNPEIIYRISEIKYDPNDVDSERFYLTMNDGNYVYVTLSKLSTLNKYDEMLQKFQNKKGILFLDSGKYFKVMDY